MYELVPQLKSKANGNPYTRLQQHELLDAALRGMINSWVFSTSVKPEWQATTFFWLPANRLG